MPLTPLSLTANALAQAGRPGWGGGPGIAGRVRVVSLRCPARALRRHRLLLGRRTSLSRAAGSPLCCLAGEDSGPRRGPCPGSRFLSCAARQGQP